MAGHKDQIRTHQLTYQILSKKKYAPCTHRGGAKTPTLVKVRTKPGTTLQGALWVIGRKKTPE